MKVLYILNLLLFTHSFIKDSLAYKTIKQPLNLNQLTIEVEPAEENTEDYAVPLALIQDIYGMSSEPTSTQALSSYLETNPNSNIDKNL